jgi:hypothetical protein
MVLKCRQRPSINPTSSQTLSICTPIFLVFDDRAWQLADRRLFRQVTYDAADQDEVRHAPSDHGPLVVKSRPG